MPIRATQYFFASELTSKLKNDGSNDDPALNQIFSEKPRDLPNSFADYSDDHKKWLQSLLCAGTVVSYQENEQILVTGAEGYNLTTKL